MYLENGRRILGFCINKNFNLQFIENVLHPLYEAQRKINVTIKNGQIVKC